MGVRVGLGAFVGLVEFVGWVGVCGLVDQGNGCWCGLEFDGLKHLKNNSIVLFVH